MSDWPMTLPDPRSLRSVREDLVVRGVLAKRSSPDGSPVRPLIERSWRRCVADAVPTARTDLPFVEVSTMALALRDAAAPVVERMSEHLGDLRVGLYVSNDKGQILLRQVREAEHRRVLDRACAAEGFDFSEVSVGTNGMGTALVERRPVLVHGAEHFSDLLEDVTCAATPIFEPFTRRLLGTFSLACATRDASPLMYGLTTDVGRQIESNLTTMLGAREQALIRAYLMAENSSRDPVLVLTERTVFANTSGVPHLDSASHAVLWDHLTAEAPWTGSASLRLPLGDGWQDALVEAVEGTRGQQPAWCIRLLPQRSRLELPEHAPPAALPGSRRRTAPSPARKDGVPGRLRAAVDARRTLAVEGAPGTGKLHALLQVLAGTDPLVLDLSGMHPGSGATWSAQALETLAAHRPVVLRHVQDLSARDVNRVRALADAAAADDGDAELRLAITWTAGDAHDHVDLLVPRLAPVVRLPALSEDPSRVGALVGELLRDLATPEKRPHLSSDALQCLLRWSWPGNVEELRDLLADLCRDFPGRHVRQADLPARLQRAPQRRVVSLMESAEREAIVKALQQADGNRSRAAEILGIGRTTLYRKMQQLRIDA